MKKLLTCLLLVSNSIYADSEIDPESNISKNKEEKIQFKISGSATAFGVVSNPNLEYFKGANIPSINKNTESTEKIKSDQDGLNFFAGYSYLNFDALSSLSNGWDCGAKLSIEAAKGSIDMNKAYVFAKHNKFGEMQIGTLKGPDATYVFDGRSLCGGGGGIDGTLLSNIEYATAVLHNRFPVGFSNKATKIVIYSPSLYGFQLGLGYTPDTKHQGCALRNRFIEAKSEGNNRIFVKGKNGTEVPNGLNNISIGIKHEHVFSNGINTKFGFAFITESTQDVKTEVYNAPITEESVPTVESIKLNDAKAIIASGLINYGNWTVAAGYLNSFKSRLPKQAMYGSGDDIKLIPAFMVIKDGNSGHGYNIGVKYNLNTWSFAGVFNRNSRKITKDQTADSNVMTITIDKKINKHINVFCEYDYVKSNSSDYACSMFNVNNKNAVKKASYGVFAFGATVSF